jgi:phosphoribosylformylglycinamidine synthase
VLRLPIKHGEGRYGLEPAALAALDAAGQVVLRYCEPDGSLSERANPNGSADHVAGVRNAAGNVMGLMPHPEHAADPLTGGRDGLVILGSLVDAVARR